MAGAARVAPSNLPLTHGLSWLRQSVVGRLLRLKLAVFGLSVVTLVVIGAVFAPLLAPYTPTEIVGDSAEKPSAKHLLGTDSIGRDQVSRLLHGARASLTVSVLATLLGTVAGCTIGLVAAYFKGVVDALLMRTMDALLSMPGLVLPLALLAAMGGGVPTVSLALGIGFMPGVARLMRGQALAQLERDYVLAAVAGGASHMRIMVRYVAPNCMAPIIVAASLGMSVAVIAEAGLSFLGLGVTPPTPTWGSMLSTGFKAIRSTPWLVYAPGGAIFLLVLSLNFLGDAIRDVLDPRLRGAL
ncbi:MAG: ABC transporter permease [Dehalococcoidia bacterium]